MAGSFTITSLIGAGIAAYIYLNEDIPKPIQLPYKWLQNFFAYDLYTAEFYRVTIVFIVGLISRVIYWFDRYLVDGVINLVGLATIFGGETLKFNASGQTQFYFLSIFLGVILFVGMIFSNFIF